MTDRLMRCAWKQNVMVMLNLMRRNVGPLIIGESRVPLNRWNRKSWIQVRAVPLLELEAQAEGVDPDSLPGCIAELNNAIEDELEPRRIELAEAKGAQKRIETHGWERSCGGTRGPGPGRTCRYSLRCRALYSSEVGGQDIA